MTSLCLDPRSRIFLVLYLNIVLFSAHSQLVLVSHAALVALLYFFSKKIKTGVKVGFVIGLLLLLQYLSLQIQGSQIQMALSLMFFLFFKFALVAITAYWFILTTKTGDFISAMESAKMPKGMIITFSVIFRFLPTVRQELWYIKSTMKLRGISPNLKSLVCHPVVTAEYALVPLMMRSMSIGNRLTTSAMTRGLDLEHPRSSYRIVKLQAWDLLACGFVVLFSLSVLWMAGGL